MQDAEWFPRLGEVPGIQYPESTLVDRRSLLGHDWQPQHFKYFLEDRYHVRWPAYDAEWTTASPAQQWYSRSPAQGHSAAATLRHLHEVLELPGDLFTYHLAIMTGSESLFRFRRTDPWVLEEVERFCLLDMELIVAYPAMIAEERAPGGYVRSSTFRILRNLYEKDGYLREAMEIARLAARFHQESPGLEKIEQRLAILEAENDV